MTQLARGSCFCGAVSVTAPRPLGRPVNCHCGECRRLSGAAFTTWITAPHEQVVIDNPDGLTRFNPTANLQRAFCRTCGSHVYTLDARMPKACGFPAGLFEGEAVEPPAKDYFLEDKATWHHLTA
ncbi:GFA family protein [Roseateles sp.]|uniref:GFA family protein n=1 Tax=Roseateles sp. TaxID=1971397 RepID=UPI0025D149D0|nr:GFA family protein [Roseateles sp.]MBV8037161.1 GFA family protein [Roseateles sp.]